MEIFKTNHISRREGPFVLWLLAASVDMVAEIEQGGGSGLNYGG
jgi:hypothetical protein